MDTQGYTLQGKALPAGGVVTVKQADLDAPETGRDESGYLHRVVLRHGLRTWEFSYRDLTAAQLAALQALLPQGQCCLTWAEGTADCYLAAFTVTGRQTLTGTAVNATLTLKEY